MIKNYFIILKANHLMFNFNEFSVKPFYLLLKRKTNHSRPILMYKYRFLKLISIQFLIKKNEINKIIIIINIILEDLNIQK